VGERGTQLSVGEKQRVSIARAILRDPRMLILDEATSSVDTETETAIQEALARLVRGRTTFVIAHRLSTLRNASRLLVIEEGRIAEMGTHDELMSKQGTYQRLVELQRTLTQSQEVER
jgi:ATP-binding cassette subfamily B protein